MIVWTFLTIFLEQGIAKITTLKKKQSRYANGRQKTVQSVQSQTRGGIILVICGHALWGEAIKSANQERLENAVRLQKSTAAVLDLFTSSSKTNPLKATSLGLQISPWQCPSV